MTARDASNHSSQFSRIVAYALAASVIVPVCVSGIMNGRSRPVAYPAGEHHKALQRKMDYPGVMAPTLVESGETILPDSARVFGIVVNGQALAFARDAMVRPTRHIVNLMIGRQPVSATYCDLVNCARVLTRTKGTAPIDLHVGGLDENDQLVLLLDKVRYGQSSSALPLEDVEFEDTTLDEWRREHPETLIYEGTGAD
jgi:hypothetical protein